MDYSREELDAFTISSAAVYDGWCVKRTYRFVSVNTDDIDNTRRFLFNLIIACWLLCWLIDCAHSRMSGRQLCILRSIAARAGMMMAIFDFTPAARLIVYMTSRLALRSARHASPLRDTRWIQPSSRRLFGRHHRMPYAAAHSYHALFTKFRCRRRHAIWDDVWYALAWYFIRVARLSGRDDIDAAAAGATRPPVQYSLTRDTEPLHTPSRAYFPSMVRWFSLFGYWWRRWLNMSFAYVVIDCAVRRCLRRAA